MQPLSAKQARLLKKLARQPDALAGLLQASTKKSAAKAKVWVQQVFGSSSVLAPHVDEAVSGACPISMWT